MNEEEMWRFFLELHRGNPQEGPGNFASTRRALELAGNLPEKPRILDIGCGPGRQTLDLLRLTDGTVTALDNQPGYIGQLKQSAAARELLERVTAVVGDMAKLDFSERSFDLVWSEGALYCMGFENGLVAVKPLLRKSGAIAVSELTRLLPGAPEEAVEFWEGEYPAMRDIRGNMALIEAAGYRPVDHFTLPESAWWDYYDPLVGKHPAFREKHAGNEAALAVLAQEEKEIAMYRKYSRYYGYVFYVARLP